MLGGEGKKERGQRLGQGGQVEDTEGREARMLAPEAALLGLEQVVVWSEGPGE